MEYYTKCDLIFAEPPSVIKEVLALRDYQLELARPALEGKNCMIVAPTGIVFVAVMKCVCYVDVFNFSLFCYL